MKRGLLVAVVLGLAGCMSVPLSTIVRMSTFDEQDFLALDPDVVRVRIKLPQGFDLNPATSSLQVKLTSEAGDHFGEFKLQQVTSGRVQLANGIFAGDASGTEYTLKLAQQSKKEFRDLQGFVKKGRPGEVVLGVAPRLSSFPPTAETVNVWIDLLLSQGQGFFTLLDGAEVPMEGIRAASAGG
jgi:hypothetical protein